MKIDTRKYIVGFHWFFLFLILSVALIIVYFIICFAIPKILPKAFISDSFKSGLIYRDEVWSGEIKINADIMMLPGARITVLPGTKILVKDGDDFNLNWLPWDLRQGINTGEPTFGIKNGEQFKNERNKVRVNLTNFYAIGSKEQPIIIDSYPQNSAYPESFNGFSINQGILAWVQLSNYRSLDLGDKVTVRDCYFKNTGDCAICSEYGSPTIFGNTFEGNLKTYIKVYAGSPKINDNLFLSSKGKGIIIDPQNIGAPIIYNNDFEMPDQTAILFLSGNEDAGGVIAFNNFSSGNSISIPCDSKVSLENNSIRGFLTFTNSGNCVGSMTIGPNFWQTKDLKAVLQEKIIGKENKFQLVMPKILESSPSVCGRRI
jgi:hypothetical protein